MTATDGIHDHLEPPPIAYGAGCAACDAWVLAELRKEGMMTATAYDTLTAGAPTIGAATDEELAAHAAAGELDELTHELVAQGFTLDDARTMAQSDDWMATPEQLAAAGRPAPEPERFVVIRPSDPGALVIAAPDLDAWAAAELRRTTTIDNPAWTDAWAMTNLIGMGYRFEPVVAAWRTCETPTALDCAEPAAHVVLVLEPGMNADPAEMNLCATHAAEMIDAGEAVGVRPIDPEHNPGRWAADR